MPWWVFWRGIEQEFRVPNRRPLVARTKVVAFQLHEQVSPRVQCFSSCGLSQSGQPQVIAFKGKGRLPLICIRAQGRLATSPPPVVVTSGWTAQSSRSVLEILIFQAQTSPLRASSLLFPNCPREALYTRFAALCPPDLQRVFSGYHIGRSRSSGPYA
jgi:hypothetical protein